MRKRESNIKVYLSAIVYSLIVGFSFVFTKIALEFSDPINFLGHRFLICFLALLIVLIFKKKLSYFNLKAFKETLPIALAYPLLFFVFQTFGLQRVESSLGGILFAVAPIFTLALAAIFLKEKPSIPQVLFVILAVSGVIFIFANTAKGGSGNTSILGVVLLLLTTLCFSIYSILARRYTKKYENLELMTVMITIGVIGFNLIALFRNLFKGSMMTYITPFTNPKYIMAVLYLGVLSTLVSSMQSNYVLKYLEAAKMSVFVNLGTLISIFAGAVILKEELFYYHLIGAAFIIVGVLGTNFVKAKTSKIEIANK